LQPVSKISNYAETEILGMDTLAASEEEEPVMEEESQEKNRTF
jgi:hypothetical protein